MGWLRPYVMLVLFNVAIELSNVRKKNKGTIVCGKTTVRCDVGTVYCKHGTVKCEKKIRIQLNVKKVRLDMMLLLTNMTIKPLNV